MDVALVTCLTLPEPDPDAVPLSAALDAAGIRSEFLAWDAPVADFSKASLTVLRSCWNYPHHRPRFLEWARGVAEQGRLLNPYPVVEWSTHKKYLLDLEAKGVPIGPTRLVTADSPTTVRNIVDETGWKEIVVKPAVSAGSLRTYRFNASSDDRAESHLADLKTHGDALVQQFLPSVEGYGERALVWIDGKLTHAVRKNPRFEGEDENVSTEAKPISDAEAALAHQALGVVEHPLMYARIDMAPGADGAPVIMELELVEPSLFFDQSAEALERYVAAIQSALATTP